MHCHNKSENNENCELCKENASLDICEQFGVEQYTYHCHQENESEENCSWCKVNMRREKFLLLRQKGLFFMIISKT